MNSSCKVCENKKGNSIHLAREMMFGLRSEFEYLECSECGCVQIVDVPSDLSPFYPEDYYSLSANSENPAPGALRSYLKHQRARYQLEGKGMMGKWLTSRGGTLPHHAWFKMAGVSFKSSILDVGCGDGWYLSKLREEGFTDLTGIDPFLSQDKIVSGDIKLFKQDLSQVNSQYDFIMLNHSFEHMNEPATVLQHAHRILKPGQCVLIRIPVADSLAWRKYKTNWVQLDAPRHLFIHTQRSMEILSDQAHFQIIYTERDSTEFQFLASEQYLKDIPLWAENSYLKDLNKSIFSAEDVHKFHLQAEKLNRENDGDSGCFLMQKI